MAVRRKKAVFHTPEIPHPSWTFVEQIQHGKERVNVWKELKPLHQRSELRQVKDDKGEPVFETDEKGRRKKVIARFLFWPDPEDASRPDLSNPKNWREFITEDDGRGNRRKNFYFREDPKVLARQRAEAERQQKLDEFFAKVDPGKLDRLVAALAGDETAEDEEYPVNYAPARWRLSNGDTLRGSREEAVEAEAALHATV